MASEHETLRVVVLISGSGTNLQALIDAQISGAPFEIVAVVSNAPGAFGLERAKRRAIPIAVVDHRAYPDRASFESELARVIDDHDPGLVVLAGFMRILTPPFVACYLGRMLNIHPSLLPKYRGLHTHERALAAGDSEHGASVHFVTAELDGGPVIIQAVVPVLPDDTPQTLAARVLAQEHVIYPLAVRWFAEGRLWLGSDRRVYLDGQVLETPYRLTSGS
ncbi:phosphoribosylglycinamide formyltransferase [Caldichromatium japonicum]|uniref:Phosphoribosylglycinamide formyltransferase n=1 Tax=Caldichromatium japonicum TaxID=2699430 RepID=A0A6G7VBP5_9GAMM|nr:phosphoribosylglycinamide formyltransferase [Caldichromatium japonicum]QIK37394.1 phosphoribosylglycinamide formyltransferase [Caldichromatium japonicum]